VPQVDTSIVGVCSEGLIVLVCLKAHEYNAILQIKFSKMKVTRVSKHTILSVCVSVLSLSHTDTHSLFLPPLPPLLSLPASGEDARGILRALGVTAYTMFETHSLVWSVSLIGLD
jgi:hypothetical protein